MMLPLATWPRGCLDTRRGPSSKGAGPRPGHRAPRPERRGSAGWGVRRSLGRRCRTGRDATLLFRDHARATRFPSDVPSSSPRLRFCWAQFSGVPFSLLLNWHRLSAWALKC